MKLMTAEDVGLKLHEAFAQEIKPIPSKTQQSGEHSISLEDNASFRRALVMMDNRTIQRQLPVMLIEALSDDDLDGVETILRFLDVNCDAETQLSGRLATAMDSADLLSNEAWERDRPSRRKKKLDAFKPYGKAQATAIYYWIVFMIENGRLDSTEVLVAELSASYWAGRASIARPD